MFWFAWFGGVGWLCSVLAVTWNAVYPRAPAEPHTESAVFALLCRIRKVWQRRKCAVKNGMLTISHATVSASALTRGPCSAVRSRGLETSKRVVPQALECSPSAVGCGVGQIVPDILLRRKSVVPRPVLSVLPRSVTPPELVTSVLNPDQVIFSLIASSLGEYYSLL